MKKNEIKNIFETSQKKKNLEERIEKAIEVLTLCDSKCSKVVINILRGEK